MMESVRPTLSLFEDSRGALRLAVGFAPVKVLGALAEGAVVRIDQGRSIRPRLESSEANTVLSFDASGLESALRTGRRLYFEVNIGGGQADVLF